MYLQYFKKSIGDEANFFPADDPDIFSRLILSFCVCITRHSQRAQNNKFTIYLQYLKVNIKDEVDFLPADKSWRLFQSDTIILGVCGQTCPNYPNNKFDVSLQYNIEMKLIFLNVYKHEGLLQIDTMILMWRFKYSQSSQISKCAMSLQYLKKEVRDEVDFLHADKHHNFSILVLQFLMEVARHAQNTQNTKLLIFMQFIKRTVSELLLSCKAFRYFTGVQSCSLLLGWLRSKMGAAF